MPLREDDPSESWALIGKEKDRALMLKKLVDIEGQVRSSERASSDIAPAHYGKVIGKGGARISYIREKYGVWVNVPKDRESPIVISGLSTNVRRAIKELEELVQQDVLQQRVVLPVEILPEDIGIAIGKGGCHACKVQEEFGVKLRTHSREHPEWPLVVEGPLGAAEKAVASIQLQENARAAVAELIANLKFRPKHVLVPVHIRREEHILVLGPEGSMVAWIERNYGVQFLWPRAENMPLLLVGLTEDVSRAEAAVMKRLSSRRAH
ncbi:vigilin-like [Penaeus vannamei]|uniref:vigilin-like n=1 Tax=Penaeus vannamei TaxID=6689 RepID=UPI00387F586A